MIHPEFYKNLQNFKIITSSQNTKTFPFQNFKLIKHALIFFKFSLTINDFLTSFQIFFQHDLVTSKKDRVAWLNCARFVQGLIPEEITPSDELASSIDQMKDRS